MKFDFEVLYKQTDSDGNINEVIEKKISKSSSSESESSEDYFEITNLSGKEIIRILPNK